MMRLVASMVGVAVIFAALPATAAGDAASGKLVFRRCSNCHALDAGDNGTGPTLHGLFGSTAGTVPGFSFSKALAQSGIVWTDATLKKFLANPSGDVPGTRMKLGAITNPQQLEDLIAYLHQATK